MVAARTDDEVGRPPGRRPGPLGAGQGRFGNEGDNGDETDYNYDAGGQLVQTAFKPSGGRQYAISRFSKKIIAN